MVSTHTCPTYFSVCSGVGGLDLALERATGAQALGYCERDAFAQAVLLARMEDETLGCAPVFDDLCALDGAPFHGLVDWLVGGIPCQPHSLAGNRRGGADERDLVGEFLRLAGEMGPRFVFVENVRGFVSRHGLGRLLGGLADLGLDAEWACVRASDVGAPHRRERVFVLAWRVPDAIGGAVRDGAERGAGSPQASERGDSEFGDLGADLAHGDGGGRAGVGLEELPGIQGKSGGFVDGRGVDGCISGSRLAHGRGERSQGEFAAGTKAAAVGRVRGAAVPEWPPGPDGDWSGVPEWLLPAVARSPAEPGIRDMADGLSSLVDDAQSYRTERLRALGNAVVPAQAALALRLLLQRADFEF